MNKYIKLLLSLTIMFTIGCEDNDDEAGATSVAFDITRIDVKSTGDASQSSPELIRFINSSEGVIVNSSQNTIDFFTISPSELTITGESINITDSDDAECSSIDVSVDESIIAVVVTFGSCQRGELYLVDASTRQKYGPYELGYNPDAVDIAVDNEFVVVVNEYDYEDECLIIGTGGNANIKYSSKFSCSTDNFIMKTTKNILVKFVYYYFLHNLKKLEDGFHGATIKHISKDYIKNIKIPIDFSLEFVLDMTKTGLLFFLLAQFHQP